MLSKQWLKTLEIISCVEWVWRRMKRLAMLLLEVRACHSRNLIGCTTGQHWLVSGTFVGSLILTSRKVVPVWVNGITGKWTVEAVPIGCNIRTDHETQERRPDLVVVDKRFPVQIPLGALSSFETQPCYQAPDDPQVETWTTQWLT